ncbi:WD40 repeat-like protein [Saitoella complicata NRRL Y-17804]|uniref:Uncharacterized protein n=1 Tax=Saitoella complicata (strain BCRC 22490 / CBS 7301 / JCM 7358 / NBRC 10748 / NRRL Y-17804) TaxID=698492 RepID=A0A0E9N9B4_SAICN|nr:WD40 repeat-like protein [Saitoella complicata NRRL Y-17804]ODQ53194.1 WD40 repeat-like protein [Saitoella complicata NRRL Y-17804]GAO46321.1 hypothetical protein G7K_0553-t1 [Saitoella complicata NRRL Y-17804]
MSAQPRLIPKYAHTKGLTRLAYSTDGAHLITVGSNQVIRKFQVDSEDEPVTIEQHNDAITGVATSSEYFATCSEDASVSLFSMTSNEFITMPTRCTLPVRDIAFSPDGEWIAVASDETVVKLVNTSESTKMMKLQPHNKSIKHIAFHPSGSLISTSCSDGNIYIWSLSSESPELLKTLPNIIAALEPEEETSARVAWHPDGRAFAAATKMKEVVVVNRNDWERQVVFKNGHVGDITDVAWSPNGAYLATAGKDGKVLVWSTKDQAIVAKQEIKNVVSLAWHPKQNTLSFTTNLGQLFTWRDVVLESSPAPFGSRFHPAPLLHDDTPAPVRANGNANPLFHAEAEEDDDDEPMGDDNDLAAAANDDWIVDDDGAGYIPDLKEREARKRGPAQDDRVAKRRAIDKSVEFSGIHEPFQPGSTPWRGKRRYLALNMIGVVWTVDQDTHNTVTVEFFDKDAHRGYHFTDHFKYDKACLDDNGTLYANSSDDGQPSTVFFRPHETWANKADWSVQLPKGEDVTSIALSNSHIVACTSKGYVRVWSFTGVPVRMWRQKHMPVVTCATWGNYVMVLGNGAMNANGSAELTYTIENVRRDEAIQSQDVVALPPGGYLQSVFFSEEGNPCIYDSDGVVLVLLHWRTPGQAKWVPLLDTNMLPRRTEGRQESYWPVAVAQNKFHCIILKGGEKHPYFPRPLFSEFDFTVPIYEKVDPNPSSVQSLEEQHLRFSVLHALGEDAMSGNGTAAERMDLAKKEISIDKALLQLIQLACKDARGSKAIELVELLRREVSLDAAVKIALHHNQTAIAEKINQVKEQRLQ